MKKIYFCNKYSVVETSISTKKPIFSGLFFRVLVIFSFFLISNNLYSQESTITGLDNVHISEGAAIVSRKTTDKIQVITSTSVKIYDKGFNEENRKGKALVKRKTLNEDKEKIGKIKKEKLIKDLEVSKKTGAIYNADSKSNASFQITNSILKQATTNHNNYNVPFLKKGESDWLARLDYYQNKDKVLYIFYHSKKVENSLFARPPPIFS